MSRLGGVPVQLYAPCPLRELGRRSLSRRRPSAWQRPLAWRGQPNRVQVTALVDTIHTASAISYEALDRPRRRVALVDACAAKFCALYGWQVACTPATVDNPAEGITYYEMRRPRWV